MSPTKINELKSDIEELNKLISIATRPKIKDMLALEVRKIEMELMKLEKQNPANDQPSSVPSSKVQSSGVQRCYDVKLSNYAWDQSDKFVKLYVTLKNVQSLKPELVKCTFTKRSVELRVNDLDNRNYILSINNLSNDVNESKCYSKIKADMVVVFLSKSKMEHWGDLIVTKNAIPEAAGDKKKEPDMENDPSNDLMGLMQKMYNDGDDEMKRAIAKAWCEGKGKGMTD